MVTLTLSDKQVVELVKQLPPKSKQAVLDALTTDGDIWWEMMLSQGEEQFRRLAAERGLEWDKMPEAERETFVDALLHEKP
ncbi:MAG: hypothetical protein MUO30_08865 [Anaerolineales bacterium]|nr:hypothetical protein [Anaerolineales bacterium]